MIRSFLRYGAQQMDRQKKWHTEVGAPPKQQYSPPVLEEIEEIEEWLQELEI